MVSVGPLSPRIVGAQRPHRCGPAPVENQPFHDARDAVGALRGHLERHYGGTTPLAGESPLCPAPPEAHAEEETEAMRPRDVTVAIFLILASPFIFDALEAIVR